MKIRILSGIFFSFALSWISAQKVNFQMHSHNDYEQEFPLTKALSNNFKSIEVDIFEYKGNIIVCHDDDNLHQKPTFVELYLEPLSKYSFQKNQSIFLLIDLKMEGHVILKNLHDVLKPFDQLLKNRNSLSQYAPIQVILSGSVDKAYVLSNDSFPYFFVDGRVSDLEFNYDSNLMPLISADIEDFLVWKSSKKINKSHLKGILEAVKMAHEQDKMIRFWNTPESPEFWDLLVALNVDLIGVDNIDQFLRYSIKFQDY